MPVEKIVRNANQIWGLWKITEDESVLRNNLHPEEEVSSALTNSQKKLEWLAGRVLVGALVQQLQLPYQGLQKDEYGKPSLKGLSHKLSLSHSYPYVAVIIDAEKDAGIDLEQPLLIRRTRQHDLTELARRRDEAEQQAAPALRVMQEQHPVRTVADFFFRRLDEASFE